MQATQDMDRYLSQARRVCADASGVVRDMERECRDCRTLREAENRLDLVQAVTGRSGLDKTLENAHELLSKIEDATGEAERLASTGAVVVVATEPRPGAGGA